MNATKPGAAFTQMGAVLSEALSSARSTWIVFGAAMNEATEQARKAQEARVYSARIGLANARAEAIIYDHLHRAQVSDYRMDWDAVRRDMTDEAMQ